MNKDTKNTKDTALFIAEGALIGIFSGLTASVYRLLLINAESVLFRILNFIRGNYLYIGLWFITLFIICCIVTQLVRFESMAASSGVPQVIGEIEGHFNPCWWRILLVKFIGGALCIFSGLSLGRSGPSIQIGAMTAKGFSRAKKGWLKNAALRKTVCDDFSLRTKELALISCGAGAGLAATFNAPLAGILFVFEGIRRTFDHTILMAGMVSAVIADLVSKLFFGQGTIFSYPEASLPLSYYWLLILLGILLGFAGAGYNYALAKAQDFYRWLERIPKEIKLFIPFLCAGILGLFLPQVLGGGNVMAGLLRDNHSTLAMLCVLLIAKFLFSVLCSGSEVPGGIFFPLLILGSYTGAIFGDIVVRIFQVTPNLRFQFIMLGMAGLFSAIVRAPVTGIVLIVEMTGCMHSLLDIAIVSILACITANLLGSKPVCFACLERLLGKNK